MPCNYKTPNGRGSKKLDKDRLCCLVSHLQTRPNKIISTTFNSPKDPFPFHCALFVKSRLYFLYSFDILTYFAWISSSTRIGQLATVNLHPVQLLSRPSE